MKTSWDEITPFRILLVILGIALIISLLPSCMVYEGSYTTKSNTHSCELMDRGQACLSDHSCCKDNSDEVLYWRTNYASTAGLYYYNDIPYWGYYSGYYYYYGYRHIYPWWYYYNFTPPYYYGISTHVHCHIGNSGYVYRPRGNWRHNNKTNLIYHHDKVHTTGVNVKNKANVPTKFRNSKVKVTNIKTNTNYTRPNVKSNKTKINNSNTIKINTNKSNTKTNINRNNRSNTNKININKQNKSNTRTNSNRRPK